MTTVQMYSYVCGKCGHGGLYRDDDEMNGQEYLACRICGNRWPGGVRPVKTPLNPPLAGGKKIEESGPEPVTVEESGAEMEKQIPLPPLPKGGRIRKEERSMDKPDHKEAQKTLLALNNYLFGQMEKLSDGNLEPAKLKDEIERAKAMSNIARDIISNAKLALDAARVVKGEGIKNADMPKMLGMGDGSNG